ncbi:MAG: glucosylglycerol-phosphate synthase [Pseudomonadota bacterium]
MSSDLVIVYHREPYEEVVENGEIRRRAHKSPNGIVPTLKSFFGSVDKAAWIAWKLADDPAACDFEKKVEIDDQYGTYTVSRLPLTEEQVSQFYHVTSKEAFWPILHAFKERYNYDPVDWDNFRDVNRRFAEAAAEEAAHGALVWVHDYNLWLVPGFLRDLRPDVRIAFFHHTPFPSADMFNALPWRHEIIKSLLACDDVGFHIPRYAANFLSVVSSLFDVDLGDRRAVDPAFISEATALTERALRDTITYNGHTTAVSVSPVGVKTAYLNEIAQAEETDKQVAQIREDLGGSRLVVSVGRTDYTKGGVQQLESFERVLEANPELRAEKLRLMHISVSANRNMTVYAEVQSEIEEAAGRINGRFGTFDWQPITLISRAMPLEELIAYYRAADAAWVTPLADGMNLVCKEFIASRHDEDGVLVLSEFAGAAVQLHDAVTTNPFSHRSMDGAIVTALSMSSLERTRRMRSLRATVFADDISNWRPGTLSLGTPQDRAAVA